jgi:hypothetical protein
MCVVLFELGACVSFRPRSLSSLSLSLCLCLSVSLWVSLGLSGSLSRSLSLSTLTLALHAGIKAKHISQNFFLDNKHPDAALHSITPVSQVSLLL